MATTVPHDRPNRGVARNLNEPWRHILWTLCVLAGIGAALLAGYRHFARPESPGDAIRTKLEAAAAEMHGQLVLGPSPAELAAIRRDFSGQDVSIATVRASSITTVTLHGVDREVCIEAAAEVRRIVGSVVVMLQGYRAPEDCSSRNDMTWWLMP